MSGTQVSPLQHARVLYHDALKALAKFRRAERTYERVLKEAEDEAERIVARTGADIGDFAKLAEQIADRSPVAHATLTVATWNRDKFAALALGYLMEVDYGWRTTAFTADGGDAYAELRGEVPGGE